MAQRWNLAAVALSIATGLVALLAPLGTSSSVDSAGVSMTSQMSLLQSEGTSVLVVLAIPALLTASPLLIRSALARHRTRVAIVSLLGMLTLLGAASVGIFFVPTLIAMAMSLRTGRQVATPPVGHPIG